MPQHAPKSTTAALQEDAYASFLGAQVQRGEEGAAVAELTIGPQHLNPHGTTHGTVIYSVAGIALAAAANTPTRSGIVSSVHIDYLAAVFLGDHLTARVEIADANPKEDVFVGRVLVRRAETGEEVVAARVSARATRRVRQA